ncbi:MAG: hypothetical protein O2864_02310 [Crenarchaeota archaeon]|nr:hypothetical protein [Thermoproteota archaeon]
MNSVSSPDEIFAASKRVIDTLYGDVSDFKINETFQKPEKGHRESWDVQVKFMIDGLKYTVDLDIVEKSGHVVYAQLIDTMIPL